MNKILVLVFFIYSQFICFSQGSWESIDVPTQQNLRSVHFADSLTGWAVGDSGVIIHTFDSGESWTIQQSNTENDIVDVFFLNNSLGWASSINYTNYPYGTLLLKTTNGGVDWITEHYPEQNIFMNCILFLDSLNGWMGGNPHALVKTNDGGINWHQADIDTSNLAFFPVLSIQFYDDQYGYACGGMFDIAGVTWRTSNGGAKWYAIDGADAPADEVHGLHIFDSLNVIGAGGDPDFAYGAAVIRTADGGINWEYEEIGIQGNAFDIDFVNELEAWAPMGPQRKFIYSMDAGSTWTDIPTPDLTVIYDVMFPDSLHGFAVGDDGAMLKYTPADPVNVNSINALQEVVTLHQNTPNPFNGSTTISFEIPQDFKNNSSLTIEVFNISGNEVAVLNHEKNLTGKGSVIFNASNLPNGIYYYQLSIGNIAIATKRMVLIH